MSSYVFCHRRMSFVTVLLAILTVIFIECGKQDTTYHFNKSDNDFVLYSGGQRIGKFTGFTNPVLTSSDSLEQVEPGVFKWTRTFENPTDVIVDSVHLTMDFVQEDTTIFNMIPAVDYNGNHWGGGKEIKGFYRDGQPISVAYHRTSVAGGTYSENNRWSVALFGGTRDEYTPFSCSLLPEKNSTVHRLIWPEEEMPVSYISRDEFGPGYQKIMNLRPRQKFTTTAWLVVTPALPNHEAIHKFLDVAWKTNYKVYKPWYPTNKIWDLGLDYTKNRLWAEEENYKLFSIGLQWYDDHFEQRRGWKYEIGWCGQNASLANSLLYDYVKNGDKNSLDKGIAVLDTWAKYGRLPNGLFRTHFDYVLGSDGLRPEVQDAANLGETALNYIEAADLAKQCGLDKPEYMDVATGICDFMVGHQESSGRYGKSWTNDGQIDNPDGTIGAFIIPPMLELYQIKKDKKYFNSALKAYNYYFGKFEKQGYTTAGALDTYCIDKESAIPLLKSALLFYKVTNDNKYIRKAEQISYYLATWQWHHEIKFPAGTELKEWNYHPFGGTSVSTQHHHMDPYALYWVNDWLKLAKLTHNDIWKQRAVAIWSNGTFGISDGTLKDMDGIVRPRGGQGEGVYQTHWRDFGRANHWLVAWPTAFRLEILRKLDNWSVLDAAN